MKQESKTKAKDIKKKQQLEQMSAYRHDNNKSLTMKPIASRT